MPMALMSTGDDVEIRLRVGIIAEGDTVRPASYDTARHPYHRERCDSDRSTYRQSFKKKNNVHNVVARKYRVTEAFLSHRYLPSQDFCKPASRPPASLQRNRYPYPDIIDADLYKNFFPFLNNMLSNITRRFYSATASNMAAKKLQVGWVSVSPRIAAIAATADETSMMLTASIVWPWIDGQAHGREPAKVLGKE